MMDALVHRGPNDGGLWHDAQAGIALSHRRLSIIDPSPAGHQPMISSCGRYILSFNGEIYNHLAIRAALEAGGAIAWRGHSDTETLLYAIARLGLDAALKPHDVRWHWIKGHAGHAEHERADQLARDGVAMARLKP